jgi:deoxyribonuclease V
MPGIPEQKLIWKQNLICVVEVCERSRSPASIKSGLLQQESETMKPEIPHSWPRRYSAAIEIQKNILAPRVDLYGTTPQAGLVLGIESAFKESSQTVYCAAVLLRYPGFTEIERSLVSGEIPFPPNPEIASFREGRVIARALEQIDAQPDLLMVHGEGISAISGIGIATHLGIIYDIPSIGCSRRKPSAKKPRVGRPKNSQAKVIRDGKEIAIALRSKLGVKSIYVSPGHHLGLDDSVQFVKHMMRGFRTPEPIRVAHLLATRLRAKAERQRSESAN